MNEDTLQRLLRKADAAAGPPPVPTDLLQRVRQAQLVRQHAWRRNSLAVAAGLVLAVGLAVWHWPTGGAQTCQGTGQQADAGDGPRITLARNQLRVEADSRMTAVQGRMTAERQQKRLAELQDELGRLQASDPLQRQLDRAGDQLFTQAGQIEQAFGWQAAVDVYRQVVDLYPHTPAAQRASARLASTSTVSQ